MSKIGEYFSELPKWAKGIIAVLVIAVIAIVVWKLIKVITKALKKAEKDKAFNNDYEDLTAQGQKPSYPQNTYIQLADKIESAAGGVIFGLGTDEDQIIDVFKQMKNDLDLVLLGKAFGVREAPDCYVNCDDMGIGAFLAYEVSQGVIDEINNDLKARGITSVFRMAQTR